MRRGLNIVVRSRDEVGGGDLGPYKEGRHAQLEETRTGRKRPARGRKRHI
jgi:hypothetical protein